MGICASRPYYRASPWRCSSTPEPALSRRAHRQLPQAGGAARRGRASGAGSLHCRADPLAGGPRPEARHRRRVPARVLAPGLRLQGFGFRARRGGGQRRPAAGRGGKRGARPRRAGGGGRGPPGGRPWGAHVGGGNAPGRGGGAGGNGRTAEKAFPRLEVDAFFLEFDSERAGGFEPLRFIPKGKKVVIGAVSTKVPALESKDELKRKIDAASKYVPLENLSLSPQCGFASHQQGSGLTFAQQEAKLRLVIETAKEVWGTT